ncbi:MAG: hypothetical protein AB7U63_19700 [Porticoccaceae bacterium]
MAAKIKEFTIRFYSVLAKKVGEDDFVDVSSLLKNYEENNSFFETLDLYENGEGYRIKDVEKLDGSEGVLYRGSFIRYRLDVPTAGERHSDFEKQIELDANHEIIEKVHWILCVHNNQEYLVFQSSMHGGSVYAFIKYLNFSDPATNYRQSDVFTQGTVDNLLHGKVVKSVEFRVGAPRSKKGQPDPEDTWTAQAMDFLKDGATIFEGKVSTRSPNYGLADVAKTVKAMLRSPTTRAIKVKVSDIDEPIDLFGDRIKGTIRVTVVGGVISSASVLAEMQRAYLKHRHQFP